MRVTNVARAVRRFTRDISREARHTKRACTIFGLGIVAGIAVTVVTARFTIIPALCAEHERLGRARASVGSDKQRVVDVGDAYRRGIIDLYEGRVSVVSSQVIESYRIDTPGSTPVVVPRDRQPGEPPIVTNRR